PAATAAPFILVRPALGHASEVRALAQALGYSVRGELDPLGILRLQVPAGEQQEALARLGRHPAVAWAEPPHPTRVAAVVPDDTYYPSFQWNLSRIGMEAAWGVTTGKPSVVVAVLDTGVDFHHPDLAPNLLPGRDFVNDDDDASDDSSHGTAVAGI